MTISVFDYTDYREYLRDYLEWKRSSKKGFTVRQFCLKAKINTDNYLLRVLRRQRNLGPKMTGRFAKALALNPQESRYFHIMTEYQNSTQPSEKTQFYRQMETLLKARKQSMSPVVDNSIFTHWYIAAIWELASCKNADLSPKGIAKALQGKISVQQAKESLEFLAQRNLLIREDSSKRYVQKPIYLTTTEGIRDSVIQLNHRETLKMAEESLNLPLAERGFYGLTIALPSSQIPELKAKLSEWVNQLRTEYANQDQADRVYRVGLHCYPLAKTEEG